MPSTLQTLINAIPTAQDGDVIASTYHNALRAAVAGMADRLQASLTLSYPPVFLPNTPQPSWNLITGAASKPSGANATGWFPLSLPQGALITSLTVSGRRTGTITSFQVQLLAMAFPGTTTVTLASLSLESATDPFTSSVNVSSSVAAVDNSDTKYLVLARLTNANTAAVAEIHAIQVSIGF